MNKYKTPFIPSQRQTGVVSTKTTLTKGGILASIVGLACIASSASAASGVWNQTVATGTVSGFLSWSEPTYWTGGVPNGIGDIADLSQANIAAGTQTITLGTSEITLGALKLGDSSGANGLYNITGGTLRFNNGSSAATLTNTAASASVNTIASAVVLDSNLNVTNLAAKMLQFSVAVGLNGNTLTSETSATDSKIVYNGLTGSGSLVVNGAGSVTLGNGTYSNKLITATVNAGRLVINSSSAPNLGDISTSGTGTVNYASSANATYSKSISGTGRLLKDTNAGILTLTGINTYTGSTTVSLGTLKAGVASTAAGGAFGKDSAVVLANTAAVVLDLAGFNTRIGSLTGGGTTGGNVTLGTATLTVGGDNTSPAAFAGIISGNGGVTKIGTGKQILSGSNSYTGATAVTEGELAIAGSLDSTSTTVSSGAILSGTGSIAGSVIINGKLAAGDSGIGTIKTGSLTLSSTGILDAELGNSGASDKVAVTGSVNLDGAELKLTLATGATAPAIGDIFFLVDNDLSDAVVGNLSFSSGSGLVSLTEGAQFQWNDQNWKITYQANAGGSSFTSGNDIAIQAQAVPEPGTWALLVGGFGMLISMQGLRKRSKAS